MSTSVEEIEGKWYFTTIEGHLIGPHDSEAEALEAESIYITVMEEGE